MKRLTTMAALAVLVAWTGFAGAQGAQDPVERPPRPHLRLKVFFVHRAGHKGRPAPRAQCLSAYGKTSCGYACTSGYGQVQCARTPDGVCTAAYGRVVCWDPPARDHRAGQRERAACLASYGEVACGYGCAAAYGKVRCAQRAGHACHASEGRITCSDDLVGTRRPVRLVPLSDRFRRVKRMPPGWRRK